MNLSQLKKGDQAGHLKYSGSCPALTHRCKYPGSRPAGIVLLYQLMQVRGNMNFGTAAERIAADVRAADTGEDMRVRIRLRI